jgi:ParB-like chromosome segregation protein Spo0J
MVNNDRASMNGATRPQQDAEPESDAPSTTSSAHNPHARPALVCPHDASQALAWLAPEQLVLSPLYAHLPPPDATKLQELTAAVTRDGVLQALLVTPTADGAQYEVVAGRRRTLAAGTQLRSLPALVRQLSPRQKRLAFLATNLCFAPPTNQDELTREYDAAWATGADDAAAGDEDSMAPELGSVMDITAQLSPFLRRHVARELLFNDPTLYQSVLDEARRQIEATDFAERKQLRGRLEAAEAALTAAHEQQARQDRTIEHLGRQLNAARVSRNVVDDTREQLEQAQRDLLTSNKKLQQQVQTLLQRLAAVEPLERLAGMTEAAVVFSAVMAVVEAAGPTLVRAAVRLLDPHSTRDAAAALHRALVQLADRVRECQATLTDGTTATEDMARAQPVTAAQGQRSHVSADAGGEEDTV